MQAHSPVCSCNEGSEAWGSICKTTLNRRRSDNSDRGDRDRSKLINVSPGLGRGRRQTGEVIDSPEIRSQGQAAENHRVR